MSTFNQEINFAASATGAGILCQLPTSTAGSPYQDIKRIIYWSIELDGTSIATAALVVAIQTFCLGQPGWAAPTVPAWNAISIATGTKQSFNWTGPLAGIRINIASFGTSTGTFFCHIMGGS